MQFHTRTNNVFVILYYNISFISVLLAFCINSMPIWRLGNVASIDYMALRI